MNIIFVNRLLNIKYAVFSDEVLS